MQSSSPDFDTHLSDTGDLTFSRMFDMEWLHQGSRFSAGGGHSALPAPLPMQYVNRTFSSQRSLPNRLSPLQD